MQAETYDYKVVKQFAVMTIVWGVVGIAAGVFIAAQLVWPALNFDLPWLTFSRLRPLYSEPARRGCLVVGWPRLPSGAGT
jgi:cytochrome c oxidase cbb3-type subunit 1